MKSTVTSVILLLLSTIAFAQGALDASPHLVFKGVPIDGTLREYVAKMQASGFTLIVTKDGTAMLKGDFAAYKGCIVGVATLKDKDLVSKITVVFPAQETWSSLSGSYFSLKELLTEKYGQPADSEERFDGTGPDDDSYKIHAVKMDRCKYDTNYKTTKGTIRLLIDHDGITSCFVRLEYRDKINSGIVKAKALDDL